MQDCSRYDIMLSARLDGTLNKKDAKELERHLAECAECRKYLRLLETVKEGLREELPDPPDSLREGIMYKLNLEKSRKRSFGAFGRWTAIAAVLCIVVFGVVKLNGSGVMGSAAAPKAAPASVNADTGGAVSDGETAEEYEYNVLTGSAESKMAAPAPALTAPVADSFGGEAAWDAEAALRGGSKGNGLREEPQSAPASAASADGDEGELPGSDSVYMAVSLPGYDIARAALDSGNYWGVCLFYDRLPEAVSAASWHAKTPEDGELERWELPVEELRALETGAEWMEFYYGDLTADRGLVLVIADEEE